ncbi:MAG TPA: UrcA family protein [Steroidobacteraceae bacterium]|jgi:UrcA family protein|nr:UrcA family protein [Steroidobacteraceae bacterium]
MQRSIRTFSIAFGAAALSLGFSAFAMAERSVAAIDTEQVKIEISYADLNLAKADQAGELYTRIERAARNLCRVNNGPSSHALKLERECQAKAVDNAVQSVDHPNLTAVYLAKTGKRSMVASSR